MDPWDLFNSSWYIFDRFLGLALTQKTDRLRHGVTIALTFLPSHFVHTFANRFEFWNLVVFVVCGPELMFFCRRGSFETCFLFGPIFLHPIFVESKFFIFRGNREWRKFWRMGHDYPCCFPWKKQDRNWSICAGFFFWSEQPFTWKISTVLYDLYFIVAAIFDNIIPWKQDCIETVILCNQQPPRPLVQSHCSVFQTAKPTFRKLNTQN